MTSQERTTMSPARMSDEPCTPRSTLLPLLPPVARARCQREPPRPRAALAGNR